MYAIGRLNKWPELWGMRIQYNTESFSTKLEIPLLHSFLAFCMKATQFIRFIIRSYVSNK